jgi:4-hydroxythreonine-4-phosphate dehydrogenase
MKEKPVIAVTMGDPAGIGPEIIVKAMDSRALTTLCRPVVVGSGPVMAAAALALGSPLKFEHSREDRSVRSLQERSILVETAAAPSFPAGRPSADSGRASLAAIEKAVSLALSGEVDAIVTCPISKEAIREAGSPYPGHTEMLASLTGAERHAMMLIGGPLRVSLVTIHIPLREVPPALSREKIGEVIDLTWEALQMFGISSPRIAVCGLNPHAGEGGIIGDEDLQTVSPAVQSAAARGIAVTGPFPADTVFHRAMKGEFDAIVSMYHDQGLGPLKTVAFDTGVNLTLGLPIIRTSVDHGTAWEIAGKGVASPASLIAAVEAAATLARHRRGAKKG